MDIKFPNDPLKKTPAQVLAGEVTMKLRDIGNVMQRQIPPSFKFTILLWPDGYPEIANFVSNEQDQVKMIDAVNAIAEKLSRHPNIIKPPNIL